MDINDLKGFSDHRSTRRVKWACRYHLVIGVRLEERVKGEWSEVKG